MLNGIAVRAFINRQTHRHTKHIDFIPLITNTGGKNNILLFWQAYDSDENGVINLREFLTAVSICSRGDEDDKINWAFNLYDSNHDGSISRKEAVEIIFVST